MLVEEEAAAAPIENASPGAKRIINIVVTIVDALALSRQSFQFR
jgi:hypothetical protein